jgi:hypothetical protein
MPKIYKLNSLSQDQFKLMLIKIIIAAIVRIFNIYCAPSLSSKEVFTHAIAHNSFQPENPPGILKTSSFMDFRYKG